MGDDERDRVVIRYKGVCVWHRPCAGYTAGMGYRVNVRGDAIEDVQETVAPVYKACYVDEPQAGAEKEEGDDDE